MGGVGKREWKGALVVLALALLLRLPHCSEPVEQVAPSLSLPSRPPAAASSKHAPPDFLASPLGFLSRAPEDSLALLPGLGPVLAHRIAEARSGKSPFTSWEELLSVRGIGKARLAALQRLARQER